ncbi:MAG: TonB-dependent receptor plug domain-containing protein, partial [Bacteroidia bacterium]|nr:TonB-dependent receptor plug domain-containing protein [Bacteroidia bacterium]
MHKVFPIIFFFLLISNSLNAQRIRIVELNTGIAVPFVTIYTPDLRTSISGDENGIADISSFSDSDSLKFQHRSYIRYSILKRDIQGNKVSLKKADFELDPVVISSSRFSEFRKDISHRITAIDQMSIENSSAQTSADILAASGNVFVQKSQMGGGSPVIRGFEANRILLVVDGVRMNNAIFRSGHLQNSISLSTDLLENVEILYGPGAVIYGSDAIGGVVHYHTKDPDFSIDDKTLYTGASSYSFASANLENNFNFHINIANQKVASLTGLSIAAFDDLRKGDNPNPFFQEKYGDRNFVVEQIMGLDSTLENSDPNDQIQSGYKQIDLIQKLSVIVKPNWTQNFNIQY